MTALIKNTIAGYLDHRTYCVTLRFRKWEIVAELAASPLKPATWFSPSRMQSDDGLDRQYWCGPVSVIVSDVSADRRRR